jgi:hypothetical protein
MWPISITPLAGSMRMSVCRPATLPVALSMTVKIKRVLARLDLFQPGLEGFAALRRDFDRATETLGGVPTVAAS